MIQLLQPSKNFLTYLAVPDYPKNVTEKEVTEYESSKCTRRTSRPAAIFMFVYTFVAPSMDGNGREAARLAGCLVRRSLNPAICRPPYLRVGNGLTVQGGLHMPSTATIQSLSHQILGFVSLLGGTSHV